MICWNCQKPDNVTAKPARLDTCPHCNSFLHCCFNCKFYDKNANHECREPQAEWVKDKNMANFCGYFALKEVKTGEEPSAKKLLSKEEAEKRWAEMLKKK